MRNVKIGLVQLVATDDIDANMENAAQKVYAAAKESAQIICLPELYRTKYFPQYERDFTHLAETIPGPSTKLFSDAAEDRNAVIIVPIYERAKGGKFYNTAAVINANGELLGTHRKIYLPNDPCFWEKEHFSQGNKGYQVFETEYADISVILCYEIWSPKPSEDCARKGADIIFDPHAIGRIEGFAPIEGSSNWLDAWEKIQYARATDNGVCIATANRCGNEDELNFWGASGIYNPFGYGNKKAGSDEEILVAEVDLDANKKIWDSWGFNQFR